MSDNDFGGAGKTSVLFTLDFSDFREKLNELFEAVPDATEKALRKTGQQLILDADNIEPRTPHLTGHLRGTGKVRDVQAAYNDYSIEVSFGEERGGSQQGGAPYALRWHEAEPGTVKWSEPGVGPKYLESKIVRFYQKYLAMISDIWGKIVFSDRRK